MMQEEFEGIIISFSVWMEKQVALQGGEMLCEEYGFKNVDAGTGNIVQTSEKDDSSFTPPLARKRLCFGAGLYPAVFASEPQQHQHRIQCHCRRSLLPKHVVEALS